MDGREYKKLGEPLVELKGIQDRETVADLVKNNSSEVRKLMKNPDIAEIRFSNEESILHLAARHAEEELMNYVLENKGSLALTEKNNDEYNILNCAVEENNVNTVVVIVKWINKHKKENEEIGEMMNGECGLDYETPLHQAYKNRNYKIMYELVKAGADPSRTNDFVFHTLHYAAADNNLEAVQAVVEGARDGGEEAEAKLQSAREATDFNSLLAGMATENEQIIRLLLHDVDLSNESFLEEHGSVLHYACHQNKVNLAKYLIEKAVPLNTENPLKQTPLCIATHRGYDAISIALLEAGVDPNQLLTDSRLCALSYAAKYGRIRLVNELVKYGATIDNADISEPIIHSAVSGGNYEVTKYLLEECNCKATTEHEVNTIKRKPLCIVIENGFVPLIKLLLDNGASPVESVNSYDGLRPVHVAINSGQRQALQILLENGGNPDDKTRSGATPAQLTMSKKKDAATFLSLLITYGISFTKRDVYSNMLIHTIALEGADRCAEFFMEFLYNNHFDQIIGLVMEEKGLRDETAMDKAISQKSEGVLKVFFNSITNVDPDYFRQHPTIFHKLIDNELFEALKSLMDCHVYERFRDVELQPIFLDSIDSKEDPYPDNPNYNRFQPSFLHKLLDCPDPLVKYHPMVTIVVREKLRFYRWWYVFTFLLYCIFLVSLFYALIQASYLCDDMLLLYNDDFSRGRAFCEVIVVIYAIFFVICEFIEFVGHWYMNYIEQKGSEAKKKEELSIFGEVEAENGLFFNVNKIITKLDQLVLYFFSSCMSYLDAFNMIGNSALLSLLILIILRLSNVSVQWTFASFAIILFSFKLFKYTRIFPSLHLYFRCIIKIVLWDVPKFCGITLILFLAYFGGIYMVARQHLSFISGQNYSNKCENQTYEHTACFYSDTGNCLDLTKSFLSGVLFLIRNTLVVELHYFLNSNFLFTFLYLAFAFVVIVIMLNLLIAQFVSTYRRMMELESFHFNIELVVNSEYKSTIAILMGNIFRRYNTINNKTMGMLEWEKVCKNNAKMGCITIIKENNDYMKKNSEIINSNGQRTLVNHEWIQDNIIELKRNQEKTIVLNSEIESKIASLEDKIVQLLKM